jgi:oligopeptide/dipeptide ABC transporter ATP-binding protein
LDQGVTSTWPAEPVLRVREMSVAFAVSGATVVRAVDRVSFDVAQRETLGIVGESGCGKSVTLRALIGLQGPGEILGGKAVLGGEQELLRMSDSQMVAVRGNEIGMIFQDPSAALNPVLSVGEQLRETLRVKVRLNRVAADTEAVRLLTRVGIPAAARRARDYPHQFSGGMRQRVMIALALACRPRLLLADEPTKALDVTIQDQILALLTELQGEYGMAMILVSHDLGVIGEVCDHVAVMYAGRIVEYGSMAEVFDTPRHPYTFGLLKSALSLNSELGTRRLAGIGGQPPDLAALPAGCSFRPRCEHARRACGSASMDLDRDLRDHGSACIGGEWIP